MNELFDLPPSLSPRLAWMKEHDVKTAISPCLVAGEQPWNAWTGELEGGIFTEKCSTGETEDEAIVALALANGWRLWTEGDLK